MERIAEPLCHPPPQGALCELARRRLPTIEAELHRRLSGSDRPIEAVELEQHVAGVRRRALDGDPLLDSGLLALCAARSLGLPVALPLSEGLALRGVRVMRGVLPPEQPPRSLEVLRTLGRGPRNGHGSGNGKGADELWEVYHADSQSPAARVQVALAAAGLTRPLLFLDSYHAHEDGPPVLYAGLGAARRALLQEAAAPHRIHEAAPAAQLLTQALASRNPWRLFQVVEAPWTSPGGFPADHAGPYWGALPQPQLTAAGAALLESVLRGGGEGDALLLASLAIAHAEALLSLCPPGAPALAEAAATRRRLQDALRDLCGRVLLPGQDGEPPLLLCGAVRAVQAGLWVLEAHHPDELGRLLAPAGPGYLRIRLFHFPREAPQPLWVGHLPLPAPAGLTLSPMSPPAASSAALPLALPAAGPIAPHPGSFSSFSYFVDGGDLRVHLELSPASHFLSGLAR